jgi:hypothetical protein
MKKNVEGKHIKYLSLVQEDTHKKKANREEEFVIINVVQLSIQPLVNNNLLWKPFNLNGIICMFISLIFGFYAFSFALHYQQSNAFGY